MRDYEAQFKSLSRDEFASMRTDPQWRRVLSFSDAKSAFSEARDCERRGVGVAFGRYGDDYVVWTE